MKEYITIQYEELNDKFYVYLNGNMIGKQYDFAGVLKQLKRETKHMKTEEYIPKIRKIKTGVRNEK